MLKTILLTTFFITINFTTCAGDSPITRLEKENLLATQELGLISPDVAILKLRDLRLRSERKAAAKLVFPLMSPRCPICSLRLKTHYGGEEKGERWCVLNELILRGMIANEATRAELESWRMEQVEIEKE